MADGMEYVEGQGIVYYKIDDKGNKTYIKNPFRYDYIYDFLRKIMKYIMIFIAGLVIGSLI